MFGRVLVAISGRWSTNTKTCFNTCPKLCCFIEFCRLKMLLLPKAKCKKVLITSCMVFPRLLKLRSYQNLPMAQIILKLLYMTEHRYYQSFLFLFFSFHPSTPFSFHSCSLYPPLFPHHLLPV